LAAVLALSLIIAPAASFAKKEQKGPQSEKAYENANENASFKRGDDSKVGGEAEDKSQKLQKRHKKQKQRSKDTEAGTETEDKSQKLQKQHKKQKRKSENTEVDKKVDAEGDESKPEQVSFEESSEENTAEKKKRPTKSED
jgi:hypothetical protein